VEGEDVVADSGVLAAQLVQIAYEAGLTGLEAWSGLPGTVGGAVFGNAGCFGTESKDLLLSAEVWLPGEGVKSLSVKDLAYGYRSSRLKREGGVVLSARFKLARGNAAEIQAKMREIAKSRIQKQPPGCSTGSFFKNPAGDHAGRLLEAAGMKGAREGKAQVSEQHANFFLNTGGASSEDILRLAARAEKAVLEQSGVQLEREVVYVPAD
jgi:UDP-N-acetylmuramate dehydrogenase